jgi:hypothetical protein
MPTEGYTAKHIEFHLMNWYATHIWKIASGSDPYSLLVSLRGAMAEAAQQVYESWEQDEEGVDPMLGSGGICDEIARDMGMIMSQAGFDLVDGGADDHAWNIAIMDGKAFSVDIPCRLYESGAWYSWRKKDGVKLTENDVQIHEVPYEDVQDLVDEQY